MKTRRDFVKLTTAAGLFSAVVRHTRFNPRPPRPGSGRRGPPASDDRARWLRACHPDRDAGFLLRALHTERPLRTSGPIARHDPGHAPRSARSVCSAASAAVARAGGNGLGPRAGARTPRPLARSAIERSSGHVVAARTFHEFLERPQTTRRRGVPRAGDVARAGRALEKTGSSRAAQRHHRLQSLARKSSRARTTGKSSATTVEGTFFLHRAGEKRETRGCSRV